MAQTTYGQTDSLALGVVEWLNGYPFSMPIKAQRRFVRVDDISVLPYVGAPAQIDVFPDIEVCDRQGISTAFSSQYAIYLLIQQRLTNVNDEDAQCSLLTRLRSEIIEGLKSQQILITNAVHPSSQGLRIVQVKNADRQGLYDLARLRGQHVYASDTILVFKAAV